MSLLLRGCQNVISNFQHIQIRPLTRPCEGCLRNCLVQGTVDSSPGWDDIVADTPCMAKSWCPQRWEIDTPFADLEEHRATLRSQSFSHICISSTRRSAWCIVHVGITSRGVGKAIIICWSLAGVLSCMVKVHLHFSASTFQDAKSAASWASWSGIIVNT